MCQVMKILFWKKESPKVMKPMRHIEFGAGLGDQITLAFTSDRYNCLERLEPREQVTIVLMSHNPFSKELFQWHPKAKQMIVRDLGFWWPKDDAERRAFHKLPTAQPFVYQRQESCRFYPSPEDGQTLGYLGSLGGYVIVNAAAGGIDRNIPVEICERSIDLILKRGYTPVVIGRTYGSNRAEVAVRERPGVVNLIDGLSVPGTALALQGAAGVLCCHSAICLLSWYLKRPVFLMYPEHVKVREFDREAHQYTFGKDYATTRHMQFSEYTPQKFEQFLSILKPPQKT